MSPDESRSIPNALPETLRSENRTLNRKDFYRLLIYHLFVRKWKDYGEPSIEWSNPPEDPGRILLIQLSSIGDVTYTLPAIAALRERWPQARIEFLCEEVCSVGVKGHPALDELHTLPNRQWQAELKDSWNPDVYDELRSFWNRLKRRSFDHVINLHSSPLAGLIAGSLGTSSISGFVVDESLEFIVRGHPLVVYRVLQLLKGPGTPFTPAAFMRLLVDGGEGPLNFWVREDQDIREEIRSLYQQHHDPEKPHVLLNTGSKMEGRRWKAGHCSRVAKRLLESGVQVGLIGGPTDEERLDGVMGKVGEHDSLVPWYKITGSLLEDIHLADEVDLVISTDSGPLHLISIRGCPVLDLAGDMWVGPWNNESLVVQSRHESVEKIPEDFIADMARVMLGTRDSTPFHPEVDVYRGYPEASNFWYRHRLDREARPDKSTFKTWFNKMFNLSLWSDQSRLRGWKAPALDAPRVFAIYGRYWPKSPPPVEFPDRGSFTGTEHLDERIQANIDARLSRFRDFFSLPSETG